MAAPIVGFIGFGEAANLISEGLLQEGIKIIYAYDVNSNHPTFGPAIRERMEKLHIPLASSLEELCEKTEYIFCATSAKAAEPIAKDIKSYLTPDHYYIDINAASPMVMEKVADYVAETRAKFVDAAVMDSVPLKKHKVPMYISGSGALDFQKIGTQFGMNLTFISEKAGSSSAIKMFRSIFMKGFSALLLETIQSSRKYGVEEIVMESLNQSVTGKPLGETANMLLTRTAIHAERRVAEMNEVIDTLGMLNVDATMSEAVKRKLQLLVDSGVREKLNNKAPSHYSQLIDLLDSSEH